MRIYLNMGIQMRDNIMGNIIDMSDVLEKGISSRSKEYKKEYNKRWFKTDQGKKSQANASRKYNRSKLGREAYAKRLKVTRGKGSKHSCIKCGEQAVKNIDILSDDYHEWNGKMFITCYPIEGKRAFGRKGKIKTCKFVCNNCL